MHNLQTPALQVYPVKQVKHLPAALAVLHLLAAATPKHPLPEILKKTFVASGGLHSVMVASVLPVHMATLDPQATHFLAVVVSFQYPILHD